MISVTYVVYDYNDYVDKNDDDDESGSGGGDCDGDGDGDSVYFEYTSFTSLIWFYFQMIIKIVKSDDTLILFIQLFVNHNDKQERPFGVCFLRWTL